jgi:hypothetical protein
MHQQPSSELNRLNGVESSRFLPLSSNPTSEQNSVRYGNGISFGDKFNTSGQQSLERLNISNDDDLLKSFMEFKNIC